MKPNPLVVALLLLITNLQNNKTRATRDLIEKNKNNRQIGILKTYVALKLLSTFASSFIWGINTLFLLDAGLGIAQAITY